MQYRKNKRNGDMLSALGMGCMRLPRGISGVDHAKTKKLIDLAIDQGINFFDVAYIYVGCEAALGEALVGRRESIKLSTKLPQSYCKTYEDFDKYFDIQLKSLKTDYVDYYLMHMLSTSTRWQALKEMGIERWIKEKKESGQIRNIGFSFHGNKSDFFSIIKDYPWEFVLVQYNYLDEGIQATREGVEYCEKNDIPVFIMEPLRGGYLSNKLPKRAKELLAKSGKTAAEVSFSWLFDQTAITMVLSGMNEHWQIEENAATAENYPPHSLCDNDKELIAKIKAEIDKKMIVPCTGCGYCMPCPFGVEIPACFASRNTFAIKKVMGWQQYILSTGLLGDNPAGAKNCKKCGKCEKHCPQSIKIPAELARARRKLEPFWFPLAKGVVKRVLKPKERKTLQDFKTADEVSREDGKSEE